MVIAMKKIPLRIEKTTEGCYIGTSSESMGFFAVGETRDEVIQNAIEGIAIFLEIEESQIKVDITDADTISE
jgi:predicted RNase H-like HicB family nuclease